MAETGKVYDVLVRGRTAAFAVIARRPRAGNLIESIVVVCKERSKLVRKGWIQKKEQVQPL